jgi:hypothetical protein
MNTSKIIKRQQPAAIRIVRQTEAVSPAEPGTENPFRFGESGGAPFRFGESGGSPFRFGESGGIRFE